MCGGTAPPIVTGDSHDAGTHRVALDVADGDISGTPQTSDYYIERVPKCDSRSLRNHARARARKETFFSRTSTSTITKQKEYEVNLKHDLGHALCSHF